MSVSPDKTTGDTQMNQLKAIIDRLNADFDTVQIREISEDRDIEISIELDTWSADGYID